MMTEPKYFESLYPENTRFDEIQKILGYIISGTSCQTIGIPGIGKSTILKLLSYNTKVRLLHLGQNQKNYHFVYMDFSEVKNKELFEIEKFIIISLVYSLGERKLKKEEALVNNFLKEALKFNDELILFQALKKTIDYLATEKGLTVVFLFDRFDQFISNATEQFFSNLKILRNRAKYKFSVIFSISRPIEDVLEPYIYSEFYEFLENKVYLPIYNNPGINFRFQYLEEVSGKKKDEKTKKEIIRLTGGHGKMCRISYELILANENTDNLTSFLSSQNQIKGALFEIWNFLNPEEQTHLKAISNKEEATRENYNQNYLTKVGLLENTKISIPLLSDFIKGIKIEKDIKITFDENTKEILKGKELITNKLSPSEFRLLKFLILNKDRVCEKEEVIGAVWKESKTQEGVTDQALDQIIYRLRKKIEENPNNPLYIQTIKGRGFKFRE